MTSPLDSARWARMDEACDRFEQAWQGDERPVLEEYLRDSPEIDRPLWLHHLLMVELGYRRDAREQPSVDEYRRRFPQWREVVEEVFRLQETSAPPANGHVPSGPTQGISPALDGKTVASGQSADRNGINPDSAGGESFGDFELLEEVGRGGMGIVYRARERGTGRMVALKVIKADWLLELPESLGRELRQRFVREAEATARLEHPHIVTLYSAGEIGGTPYYAMRFVAGRSLARILEEDGPLDNRRAACCLEKVAQAVHHAHQQAIFHRDLKPRNVLIGSDGEPLIVDFGIAKLAGEGRGGATHTGQLLGTPSYMSPEQTRDAASVTAASDVYSLGATLYDVLTGRPPFWAASLVETIQQVQSEEPVPPRRLNRAIDRELESICLKCLEKEPRRRYATAEELADDLRRYLDHLPTRARPIGRLGRLGRWCRRHPGRAAALAFMLLLLGALVAATSMWAVTADSHAREQQRMVLVQQIQQQRSTDHRNGWRERTIPLVRQAAAIRKDATLKNQAAALLGGLDARLAHRLPGGGSALAFDAGGEHLLIGGLNDHFGHPHQPGRLWNLQRNEVIGTGLPGDGPVRFARDGTPLQFVPQDRWSLVLWDVRGGRPIHRFRLADAPSAELTNETYPVLALSPDGSLTAASADAPDGRGRLLVWDAGTGKIVREWSVKATALAFTPDNRLLAVGDSKGVITVWRMAEQQPLATLQRGRMEIHALNFVRHPVRSAAGSNDDWLLAAGEHGGPVSVWDLGSRQLRTRCLSGSHDVAGVAFSPDGTLVAGAERGPAQLWDAATGQFLLALGGYTLLGDVAFSPDGKRVAISSIAYFGSSGEISVWNLDRGRGLYTMRGLSARIAKVRFSANGRLLAALTGDWQVGIWDWQTRQLRRVLDVPAGVFADNAGFDFSPDGSQFAFVSGKQATLWDVASGKQIRSWTLPPALQDQVAFPVSDTLLVIRIETLGGKVPPHGTKRSDHPRVCRVRNLLGPAWEKPLVEKKEFRGSILSLLAAGDGRFFLAEGNLGDDGSGRVLKAFDSRTGAELWSRSLKRTSASALLQSLDPTGRLLVFPDEESEGPHQPSILIATDSWQEIAHQDPRVYYLSPGGEWRARYVEPSPRGWAISRGSEKEPRVVLGIDIRPSSELCEFNPAGNLFTWGNPDGTVMVCDIPELGRQLAELDLDW